MVDKDSVRAYYDKVPIVKRFFDKVGVDRQRNRWKTTVAGIVSELDCAAQEAKQLCICLQGMGAGRYVVGRKGRQSRFEWSVEMLKLSEMARGAASENDDFAVGSSECVREVQGEYSLLRHSFRLRQNLTLEIELPNDLTLSESQRIAGFVQSLPFSG